MLKKLYQKMLVYGILKVSKSGVAITPITRRHKACQGNKRKSFVADLSRLFVTGYSRFLGCYEWLSQNSLLSKRSLKCY